MSQVEEEIYYTLSKKWVKRNEKKFSYFTDWIQKGKTGDGHAKLEMKR